MPLVQDWVAHDEHVEIKKSSNGNKKENETININTIIIIMYLYILFNNDYVYVYLPSSEHVSDQSRIQIITLGLFD